MQQRKLRRKARKNCLQVLYCNEISDIDIYDVVSGKTTILFIDNLDDYAKNLITGTIENKRQIDSLLKSVSKNWSLNRMSIVDRCLLRQSIYEMLFLDDVPISVSINEAVELAKQFGGDDDSHKFVNGILGEIAKQIEKN